MKQKDISDERKDYSLASLSEDSVNADPIKQFEQWLSEVRTTDQIEPTAMNIATATDAGDISSRMVLLKAVDSSGFSFFTNYDSQKSQDLAANANAAICFWWSSLERQVRVQGEVVKVSEQESDKYFNSRPRGSRIGAIASQQSQVIASSEILEQQVESVASQYQDQDDIPRPEYWGGYRVKPSMIEFWQGRPSRLHDRIRYILDTNGHWQIERLSP
jgi:pyridoxamine 5'-phosphate oxidase